MKRLVVFMSLISLFSCELLYDNIYGTYVPYALVSNNEIKPIDSINYNLIVKSNGIFICEGCDNIQGLELGNYGVWRDINIDYLCGFVYKKKDGKVYQELGTHQVDENDLRSIISFNLNIDKIEQRLFFKKISEEEKHENLINGKKDSDILSEFSRYIKKIF